MDSHTNTTNTLLLSVDIGTTACKAGIFTKDGELCALSYNEYPLIYLEDNYIEQDAELWWELVKQSISDCVKKLAPSDRLNIKAIGISAQGIAIVPVDKNGKAMTNAISWLDGRAVCEASSLEEHFGAEKIFETTGIPPNPCFMLPKIMWLKKNKPDIYSEIDRICTCQDFITARLAGKYITDHSIAGGSMMYDMEMCEWSEELLSFAGVDKRLLPELKWAGEIVGFVLPEITKELSLPEHVLVVLGGHDQECAGIGGGLRKGRMTASLGTASIILGSLESPAWDKKMRIPCLASVEKNQWVLEAAVNVGGAGLRWLRDTLKEFADMTLPQKDVNVDYNMLMKIASLSEDGCGGVRFYPHMTGATAPYWTQATGFFDGITLSSGMAHMVRAVVEGWCYQIRHNAEIIQGLTCKSNEIVVFGGGAKSTFVTELLANILNITVLVTDTPETALLGAAIVAGVGCGTYKNLGEAQDQALRFVNKFTPNQEIASRYEGFYKQYINIEKHLLNVR